MRRISASGGLTLGVPDSDAKIDIYSFSPRPVEMSEAVEAITSQPVQWHSWRTAAKMMPGVPGDNKRLAGVVGIAEDHLNIRFLYPRKQNPLDALREIETAEPTLPPALAGACLAAAQAKRRPTTGPLVIARICGFQSGTEDDHPRSRLSRRELNALVTAYVDHLAGDDPSLKTGHAPSDVVDRARFWLVLARRLWLPETLAQLCNLEIDFLEQVAMASLAAARLELSATERVKVAGTNIHIEYEAMPDAWVQVLEWLRCGIPAEALRYLTNSRLTGGEQTVDLPDPFDQPGEIDADLCAGLAAALLREAAENAVYAPSGNFTLHLPAEYPLRLWGVAALRVWAHAHGLYAAVLREDNSTGVSFGWKPNEPLGKWVISGVTAPMVEVTLAALWRDLRVAGERAVPEREKTAGKWDARQEKPQSFSERAASSKPRRATQRTLPGQKKPSFFSGHRTWGSQAERAYIVRRAHGVRGHLRRLHEGWKASEEARKIAGEYGVVVPDGRTFVRPYVTRGEGGGRDRKDFSQVVVHSKGLASVMALLR